ncbi:PREDICTED: uncharacterized protein LOC109353957 [Lupinus angustifolius]|uniref:uncharacterized protein LOC109353957 n=1 Tax=Lupinus angustifolius TaxID=3871 RepID=UPI00092EC297|nr:PREDICTED: uncharacterized protein LOC109353957 [Lupinus angustifolius]
MENGKLIVRVENDEIQFDIFKAMHHPRDKGQSFQIDILEEICSEQPQPDNSWDMQEHNLEDGEKEQLIRNPSDNQFSPELDQGGDEKKEPEPELKELPSHSKYVFLKGDSHKPIMISNSLSTLEEKKLIQVLERHEQAIGWMLKYLKGNSPSYCMHKMMMEDDFKPVAQPQRRLNPTMKEVVWKEVVKMLEVGMIYPISGSKWITINSMRLLEKITSPALHGPDVRKIIRADLLLFPRCKMPFATFQRCIVAIFADLVQKCIEVFMDDFSVFGDSFDICLKNLETVLERCVETNLVLNWEKCHFMVTQGIVLRHKISRKGIEVDKAKLEVIEKLPPPTNANGIRSFLEHAGFYRCFIKDFSKTNKPICNLLLKDSTFNFDDSCLEAFNSLKIAL